MRKDMAKKLVETHRSSAPVTYKNTRTRGNDPRGFENAPKREKIMVRYGYDRKEFGENFPPLIGFLRKNVGRKWDSVYSELCSSLKGGGAVIEHTKIHLFRDFLTEKPFWIDGKPHARPEDSYRGPTPLDPGDIYVGKTGILSMVPHKPKKAKRKWNGRHMIENRVVIDKNTQYRKIDGHWFEILIKRLPRSPLETGQVYYDVFLKTSIAGQAHTTVDWFGNPRKPEWVWYLPKKGANMYACEETLKYEYPEDGLERHSYAYSKRQLATKDIARLGLKDAKTS
jgi:hypothetical protein